MKRWLRSNRQLFRLLLQHLDTPVSLATWLLLEHGEWDQLATRWVDPQHYPEGVFSALRYRKDVQAVDLLRKAPLPTTFSRKANALAAWESAETMCTIQNEFLERLRSTRVSEQERAYAQFLGRVRKRLARWLGPVPKGLDGGFGPGTCVEYKGVDPTLVDKLWLTPTTTPACSLLFAVNYGYTLWGQSRLQAGLEFSGISRGNRLTTVPKDGKTDRPISIEPLGNLWLQLGIGRHLKKRIRQVGLPRFSGTHREILPGLVQSYDDAQTVHRRLARLGRSRDLATIDLSSASDTISLELVRWVIPPDWFELLDKCRSKHTLLPRREGDSKECTGHWRRLEKFSSMGNGFTFELETLIFLGLLSEACGLTPGRNIWVFGDDIIIPASDFDRAVFTLETSGFTVNSRKSYGSGPFRESCGGHFHSDLDVNSVRLKGEPDSIPALIALHNELIRWGFPFSILGLLRSAIPLKYRITGPEGLGDNVLLYPGGRVRVRSEHGIAKVRTLKFRPTQYVPLERWSDELSIAALLLGYNSSRTARRGTTVCPTLGWTSVTHLKATNLSAQAEG